MSPEKSAENMEGVLAKHCCQGMQSCGFALCSLTMLALAVFSYTESCIHSQACKSNSSHCAVITVALLINEVYRLHIFVIVLNNQYKT